MAKLIPLFLVMAAFFLAALAAAVSYDQTISQRPPAPAYGVSLVDGRAVPDQLIIELGQSVQFIATDEVTHDLWQVNQDGAPASSAFQSGDFTPAQGYRLQFRQAGDFYYIDHLHPQIRLKVIVYDPAK